LVCSAETLGALRTAWTKILNIPTRVKVRLAGIAAHLILAVRRIWGGGRFTDVRRGGITWRLDLLDGIDFSIFLLGYFEPATVAAYRRILRPGDIALDIGANRGAHSLPLAQAVGSTGKVIAFEPTARAYRRLIGSFDLNPSLKDRVIFCQSMLAASPEKPIPEKIAAYWPLHAAMNQDPLHMGVEESTENASVETLDDALSRLSVERVDFIKMDVDGFEMEVLNGAIRTISHHHPTIVMEIAPYMLEEKGIDGTAPITFLTAMGYKFFSLRRRPLPDLVSRCAEMENGTSMNVIAIFEDS